MKKENKPCPFCGNRFLYVIGINNGVDEEKQKILCADCGAIGPFADNAKEAWVKWDCRTENEQLKKMVDWLAEKACQCAEASKQGGADDCFICIQNRNMPTPNDWREAAERAVCQMK